MSTTAWSRMQRVDSLKPPFELAASSFRVPIDPRSPSDKRGVEGSSSPAMEKLNAALGAHREIMSKTRDSQDSVYSMDGAESGRSSVLSEGFMGGVAGLRRSASGSPATGWRTHGYGVGVGMGAGAGRGHQKSESLSHSEGETESLGMGSTWRGSEFGESSYRESMAASLDGDPFQYASYALPSSPVRSTRSERPLPHDATHHPQSDSRVLKSSQTSGDNELEEIESIPFPSDKPPIPPAPLPILNATNSTASPPLRFRARSLTGGAQTNFSRPFTSYRDRSESVGSEDSNPLRANLSASSLSHEAESLSSSWDGRVRLDKIRTQSIKQHYATTPMISPLSPESESPTSSHHLSPSTSSSHHPAFSGPPVISVPPASQRGELRSSVATPISKTSPRSADVVGGPLAAARLTSNQYMTPPERVLVPSSASSSSTGASDSYLASPRRAPEPPSLGLEAPSTSTSSSQPLSDHGDSGSVWNFFRSKLKKPPSARKEDPSAPTIVLSEPIPPNLGGGRKVVTLKPSSAAAKPAASGYVVGFGEPNAAWASAEYEEEIVEEQPEGYRLGKGSLPLRNERGRHLLPTDSATLGVLRNPIAGSRTSELSYYAPEDLDLVNRHSPTSSSPVSPTLLKAKSALRASQQPSQSSSTRSADIPGTPEEHLQIGIECHESGDLNRATYHFRESAIKDGGCCSGKLLYGLSLRHGWGCQANPELSFKFLQEAAEIVVSDIDNLDARKVDAVKSELVLALHELGMSFRFGWGVAKDKKAAVKYFELAADLGDPDACADCAYAYAKGKGCKKDMKKAAKYYRMAVAQGGDSFGLSWIWKPKYAMDT